MIDLSVFSNLAGIDIDALADKPTTLTPGQKEAATSLWVSPDGAGYRGLGMLAWQLYRRPIRDGRVLLLFARQDRDDPL